MRRTDALARRNFTRGDVGVLTGAHGEEFIVDLDVFARIRGVLWCASECEPGRFYAKNRRMGYLHKFVAAFASVDHRNRDTFDNRRKNLRDGGGGINAANTRKRRGCQALYRCVYRNASGNYFAEVTIKYAKHYLGTFATPEEARDAVLAFAAEHRPGVVVHAG